MGKRRTVTLTIFAIAVILLAVVGMGWWANAHSGSTGPVPSAGTAGAPGPPADAFPMVVERISDGDTLRARVVTTNEIVTTTDSTRIRLIGIDTPELDPLECWAHEATDRLTELAPVGSTIWIGVDEETRDRYDRRLFYLWTDDGRFINYELVADGSAEAIRVAPNDAHFDLLRAAQGEAEGAGLGRWGAC